MPGTLFVVATPIGNLEDVSMRALRVLREVAVIAAEDTRRTAHLLARYAITTPTTSLHEHNENRKTGAIIERLQHGENVAIVSDAGTPTVSDPGARLIRAAIDEGIRVESIPGPSAVMTALSGSGMPTESFTFVGFAPTRTKDRKAWFERLKQFRNTVILFEAPHRIQATLEELLRTVGDCQAVIARELTKTHEELVRGPISTLIGRLAEPRGEFTVVLDLGCLTEIDHPTAPTGADIAIEFGVLTKNGLRTRRAAISSLARKYGISAKAVYQFIESAKSSLK